MLRGTFNLANVYNNIIRQIALIKYTTTCRKLSKNALILMFIHEIDHIEHRPFISTAVSLSKHKPKPISSLPPAPSPQPPASLPPSKFAHVSKLYKVYTNDKATLDSLQISIIWDLLHDDGTDHVSF